MDKMLRPFRPNYIATPGAVLEGYLESYELTQADLAAKTGLALKTVNEIVQTKAAITAETAQALEFIFGRPTKFWLQLEEVYTREVARIKEDAELEKHYAWAQGFPVKQLCAHGYIDDFGRRKCDFVRAVFRFFAVTNVTTWERWIERRMHLAYKKPDETVPVKALATWLQIGEIEAAKLGPVGVEFDRKKFKESIAQLVEMSKTKRPAEELKSTVTAICARAGVRVLFVDDIGKSNVLGMVRWLGKNPLMQLSMKGKKFDNFWFTFFHEAYHILHLKKKDIVIDRDNKENTEEEMKADAYANRLLA